MQPLISFFKWVLISSAMAGVIVCVILFIKYLMKDRVGAKWHYYIWLLLMVKLLVPFWPQSPLSIFNAADFAFERLELVKDSTVFSSVSDKSPANTPASISKEDETSIEAVSGQKPAENGIAADVTGKGLDKFISGFELSVPAVIWLGGVIIFAVYISVINIRLSLKLRKCEQFHDKTADDILQDCRSFMDISRNIPIYLSMSVNTPTYTGLFKPRILLPQDFIGKVDADELRHILLHELAHYKRKDIFFNWVAVILKVLHWFNPLIWYGFYRMREDCETACDEMLLSRMEPDERLKYGHMIIRLLEIIPLSKPLHGTMGILTGRNQIKRRITMISLFKKETLPWTITAVLIIISVGFVCLTDSSEGWLTTFDPFGLAENEKKYMELDSKYKELHDKYNNMNDSLKDEYEKNRRLEEITDQLQQQLKNSQILAGTTDIEGKGIILTLTDRPESGGEGGRNIFLVHDMDLLNIVNELTSTGVEAISINDERLIATSKIKASGPVILINNNRYTSPFVIKAIGDPDILERVLKSESAYLEILQTYQIGVVIEKSDKLNIPGYKGNLEFKYAQPLLQSMGNDEGMVDARVKELQNSNPVNRKEALKARIQNDLENR